MVRGQVHIESPLREPGGIFASSPPSSSVCQEPPPALPTRTHSHLNTQETVPTHATTSKITTRTRRRNEKTFSYNDELRT